MEYLLKDSVPSTVKIDNRYLIVVVPAVIGFVACQWHYTYPLASIVLLFWLRATSRIEAVMVIGIYTLFSTWVVVPAIVDYLSWPFYKATVFWMMGVAVVMAPWALLYRQDQRFQLIRLCTLLVVTFVPPIGLVQFASPFVGSSLLVPGHGFVSVLLGIVIVTLVSGVMNHPKGMRVGFVVFPVLMSVSYDYVKPSKNDSWLTLDTNVEVGGLQHTVAGSFDALNQARKKALSRKPRVLVLGESTGGFSLNGGAIV